ncbi:MAG: hypothetical protein ACJ8M1_01505 [Chthoniobacterales bacterium]
MRTWYQQKNGEQGWTAYRVAVLCLVTSLAALTFTATARTSARTKSVRQFKPAVTAPAGTAATPSPTPCGLPGVQILTDPAGDESSVPGIDTTTLDIERVYFAEPGANADKITYTMKVANLNSIPPNGSWIIEFVNPIDSVDYFVSMDSDTGSGLTPPAVTYHYGTHDSTTGYSTLGLADSGSFSPDGTITITNSNAKMGNPKPGTVLNTISGTTQILVGTQGTGILETVDDTSTATANTSPPFTYTVVGNVFCGMPNSGSARTATYIRGGVTFSANSPLKCPTSTQDGEPSSRVDQQGNYYIMPIRGVPAGVDLFYFDLRSNSTTFDPNMRVPVYRGQPDAPTTDAGQNALAAGALGGGDIDLAIGFGNYPGDAGVPGATPIPAVGAQPNPVMAYASLLAANVTVGRSLDRGQTFQFNGAGNIVAGVPVNDRQWMGFIGNQNVYLVYRNFAQGIAFVQQSNDGGLVYGPALPAGGISFPQTGALDVDQQNGIVYVSSNDGHVAVGDPSNGAVPVGGAPTTYTVHSAVPAGVDSANIFFPIRVASDNGSNPGGAATVYGVYSDGHDIYLVSSADKGQTWAAPVRVNDAGDTLEKTNLMPWLAAGPTPGTVGVAWYATDNAANDDNANWRLFYAFGTAANSSNPTFQLVQASDHAIHTGNISTKGLVVGGQSPNRNLIDYFQINFDPAGAAVIGFTDDHIDFRGHTYVTRQISGPTATGVALPNLVNGTAPEPGTLPAQPFATPGTLGTGGSPAPQPMQPGPNGEQVTDFPQDQSSGLVAVAPANSPVDILTIKYQSQDSNTGFYITGTMKVSDLTAMPNLTVWRMYFSANAPDTGIVGPPGNQFSKGMADRGDMFFIDAETDAAGTLSFKWGTTTRNFDGSTTDTVRGAATHGFINKAAGLISVRMSVNALNSFLDSIHNNDASKHIIAGSVLCGLRGRAQQQNASGENVTLSDLTRGGTEFKIGNPF